MIYKSEHGGDIYSISNFLGFDPSEILDFSSNVLPFDLFKSLNLEISELTTNFRRLPEPHSQSLIKHISSKYNLPLDSIIVSSGTTEILDNITRIYRNKRVCILGPTYKDYEKFSVLNNLKVEHSLATEGNNFIYDLNNIELEKNFYDIIILCNPNNPTGVLYNHKKLVKLIERLKNTLFVIDESYMPFLFNWKDYTLLNNDLDNTIVLQSFSKIYGAPGLRLGWAYSKNKKLIEKLKKHQSIWSVNSMAQFVGEKLLYINTDSYVKVLNSYKDDVSNKLSSLDFLKFYPSVTNFIMFKYVHNNPMDLYKFLLKNRVLIRNLYNIEGLDEKYFRIAINLEENNNYLIDLLNKFKEYGM
ncbi:MAG: histidinol-phosphate transaminase [Deferribacterota bacterium]|nr:histidinol-phosphate transaminase [Deferribacterota bacterium]